VNWVLDGEFLNERILPEPTVVFTLPQDGATDIALNTVLTLVFSLDVDILSLENKVSLKREDGTTELLTGYATDLDNIFYFQSQSNLLAETTYEIHIAPGYLSIEGSSGTQLFTSTFTTTTGPDITPPEPIINVVGFRTDSNTYAFTWDNPSESDLIGVMVLRSEGAPISAQPESGVLYGGGQTIGNAEVVGIRFDQSFLDTVPNDTALYHYGFYAYDNAANYQASIMPFCTDVSLAFDDSCLPGMWYITGSVADTDTAVSFIYDDTPGFDPLLSGTTEPESPSNLQSDVPIAWTLSDTPYVGRFILENTEGTVYEQEKPYNYPDTRILQESSPMQTSYPATIPTTWVIEYKNIPNTPYSTYAAEYDSDPATGVEAWQPASFDSGALELSQTYTTPGFYRFRIRGVATVCEAGLEWVTSDEFEIYEIVTFPDDQLDACVRDLPAIPDTGPIPLSDALNITNLTCIAIQIGDLAGMEALQNLVSLNMNNNYITDISPLSNLTSLISLSLDANMISDITPVSTLTNLDTLQLAGNSISNLSPLNGLSNLSVLGLRSNSISNLSFISGLTGLTSLYLDYNNIVSVLSISGLTNLQDLFLMGNSLTNIAPLSTMFNLVYLHLENNDLSDIGSFSGIYSCASNATIFLDGNPLDSGDNPDIAALTAKGCTMDPSSF